MLAYKDQNTTPTVNHALELKEAGLGKKEITFQDKKAGHDKVLETLENEYPKLKSQNGGFELLRAGSGGNSRPISLLPPSAEAYTVPHIKNLVGSSTLIYIRPIQSDLSLDKIAESSAFSPSIACQTCGGKFSFQAIRKHNGECNKASTSTADSGHPSYGSSPIEVDLSLDDQNDEFPVFTDVFDPLERSSSTTFTGNEWALELANIFPHVDDKDITDVTVSSSSFQEAANVLIDKTMKTINDNENKAPEPLGNVRDLSLEMLLRDLIQRFPLAGEKTLRLERDSVWMDMLRFYKRNMADEIELRKELVVQFENEEGLDGGAIKREFFALVLKEIRSRLFEGKDLMMLPIRDAKRGLIFRIAGVVIAHSVIQHGPIGFPFLAPCVYQHMTHQDEDIVLRSCTKDIIPQTAATELLLEFLTELDNCETDEATDALLENNEKSDVYWVLINASCWPKEEKIKKSNKAALAQHLIHNELLVSRVTEMEEFGRGLQSFGLFKLAMDHPQLMQYLFVHNPDFQKFEPEQFLEYLKNSDMCDDFSRKQAYEWLLAFIKDDQTSEDYPGGSRLSALFSFCTGLKHPSLLSSSSSKIMVQYHPDDDTFSLPVSSACLNILTIPTVHSSQIKFFQAMDIALKCESEGFPNS